ncbi:MAG TPA: hypothetical protein VFE47_25340 [Tepidisphaeraceae bacterium]|jgi:hypothetical protein|nr:hypothetical protein [Tepidisphaeraceae bacterium]
MTITEDLILGASYSYTKTGPTLVRMFDVGGLTPGKDTLAQAAMAVDPASNARIPRYGQAHPAVPGLFAIKIDAEPISGSATAARVKVQYGTPADAPVPGSVQVRIGGSSGHKLMTQLPDGSLIVLQYTDPDGNALQDHVQIPILAANTVLEITRQESASPLRLSETFRRTVNASPWQGGEAKTWLCRGIDAVSQGGLSRYEVRYTFEYDPDGWERVEYFMDRYTGKVPDDVKVTTAGTMGVKRVLPYAMKDFSQLGLPNV